MTEVTNRNLLTGLKKRLDEAKENWVEELYPVLWAKRTTLKKAAGDTPFSLAYGMEAVVPVELGFPSYRVANYDHVSNNEQIMICKAMLAERRQQAAIRAEAYRRQAARYHNKKGKAIEFKEGELVLKNAEIGRGNADVGKLQGNWEGPYQIAKVLRNGAYWLMSMDGTSLPRSWNVQHLRKYYQ